ncbi:MAG: hypothetical protein ACE5GE_02450 [Phycisphaerae bacterium]
MPEASLDKSAAGVGPPGRGWIRLGLAGVLGVLVGHSLYLRFLCDDAFISFRYAENLVRHGQLTYNLGQPVEGYTNFLWTLLMAGGLALGLDPVRWALGWGLVAAGGTLGVVYRLGRSVDRLTAPSPNPAEAKWHLLAPALLAVFPPVAGWSNGGLETSLFMLLLTAAWWRYWCERIVDRGVPWSGLIFALASLTRPEGYAFFAVTALHRLLDNRLGRGGKMISVRDAVWAGLFLLPTVPHQVWRIAYYGAWLPNTYYAKVAGVDHQWHGLAYLQSFVTQYWVWLVVPLLLLPRPTRRGSAGAGIRSFHAHLLMMMVMLAIHVVRAGGDFMALHRFFVPVAPMLAVLVAESCRNAHRLVVARWAWPKARPAGLYAIETLLAGIVLIHLAGVSRENRHGGSGGGIDGIDSLQRMVDENAACGRWLARHAKPGDTVATAAAGALPYYSRLRCFDMHGLTEPIVARSGRAWSDRPGHARMATLQQVMAWWRPTYFVGKPAISDGPFERSRGELRELAGLGYRWRVVPLPDRPGAWWGFYRRVEAAQGATASQPVE